jgi:hypothetical protein
MGACFLLWWKLIKKAFCTHGLAEMLSSCKLLSTEAAVFSIYTLRKGVPVLAALARAAQLRDTALKIKVIDFPVSSRDVT